MIYALIILISIISIALVMLRTNTGVVFLAVCSGSVLLSAAGKDTDLLAHSFSSSGGISNNILQAGLVLLPGVISAILLMKRIPRKKIILLFVPAFCTAVIGLTLVYPFLSSSFQNTLIASKGWSLIAQYYELLVVVGIVSSLFTIAFTVPRHHNDDSHKKSKH